MRGCWIVFFLVIIITFTAKPSSGQRVFLTGIGDKNRIYHLSHAYTDAQVINAPVILWLYSGVKDIRKVVHHDSVWKKLNTPAVMIFPLPAKDSWKCDSTSLNEDITFLHTILREVYDNFHIDRNRVYIVTDGASQCLAEKYIAAFSKEAILSRQQIKSGISAQQMIDLTGALLQQKSGAAPVYAMWKNPLYNEEAHRIEMEDSIKRVRWERRVSVEFRTGGFYLLPGVRTEKDKTYMDISDAHSVVDLTITSWMNDSMAWFFDLGWIKVPQKQEMDGVRIEAGGGMILPITLGFRYAFYRYKTRPYILLGTGPMPVIVFGGRFGTNIDPEYIRTKIKAEARMAFHTTIGTGFDYRFGKRILTCAHFSYIHSSEFESAGAVKAIRGCTGSASIGYIFGANRLKRNYNQ
jgi:hypothetical protein